MNVSPRARAADSTLASTIWPARTVRTTMLKSRLSCAVGQTDPFTFFMTINQKGPLPVVLFLLNFKGLPHCGAKAPESRAVCYMPLQFVGEVTGAACLTEDQHRGQSLGARILKRQADSCRRQLLRKPGSAVWGCIRVRLSGWILPAPADHGIVFVRTDLDGARIPGALGSGDALAALHAAGRQRGATVSTVEHVMAALVGTGINNAVVEVNGPEIPILDGSSAPFVQGSSRPVCAANWRRCARFACCARSRCASAKVSPGSRPPITA